jgi:hypothetical protein
MSHDKRKEALAKEWYTWKSWPWQQPIDKIRAYFVSGVVELKVRCARRETVGFCCAQGEKVAMYFSFLGRATVRADLVVNSRYLFSFYRLFPAAGLYTMWLVFPSIVGLPLFLQQSGTNNINVVWMPIYGILIALWITFFLEFWKREQSFRAMTWGTSDFETVETLRPEYVNSKQAMRTRSAVTGKVVFFDAQSTRIRRVSVSTVGYVCPFSCANQACQCSFLARV